MGEGRIKRAIERVPGGMMVVPLLVGTVVATLFPTTPKVFGSFTGALFTGALPILAVFYVCMAAPATVLVAATVVVTAILTPLATAWTARHFGGPVEAARGGAAALSERA